MPRAKPGQRFGGRTKGTPNKLTATVKEALEEAFTHAGGADYLKRIAVDDPKTFCSLLARIIPTQVTGNLGLTIEEIRRTIVDPNGGS